MSKKIAVIGECMIELSEKNGAVNRGFGGDTLNTSVYIARQTDASALSVHYVTALGTDAFSQQMLGQLATGKRQHRSYPADGRPPAGTVLH
ncbi:ketodeoxygluconokinase [Klebsiella pneumoniae]|uniref:Ketodeoxygluconokinase n=1 Tax=Klebsiella pneumoniae TaxID=573 RepID=A0A2X3CHD4_KLEPN|nr:ketodeoxygluconokinase [Klebsiella pneumoniae]